MTDEDRDGGEKTEPAVFAVLRMFVSPPSPLPTELACAAACQKQGSNTQLSVGRAERRLEMHDCWGGTCRLDGSR